MLTRIQNKTTRIILALAFAFLLAGAPIAVNNASAAGGTGGTGGSSLGG